MRQNSSISIGGWRKEDPRDVGVKVVLFLISPFLSFIYSLARANTRSSFVFFFLFAVFFGMAFTVTDFRDKGMIDGVAYRIAYESYAATSHNMQDLIWDFKEYLSFENEYQKDFYSTLVFYLASHISDNYHWLFMILASVFAIFQLLSLRFFVQDENYGFCFYTIILLIIFTWNQIFNINGFRFWTAAWISVYGLLLLFYRRRVVGILPIVLTPLIHGAFVFFVLVIIIALLARRKEKFWSIALIVSVFLSSASVSVFRSASVYFPGFIGMFIDSYTDVQYLDSRSQSAIGQIFSILNKVQIFFLVYLLYLNKDELKDDNSRNLMRFLLVFSSIVNFVSAIPSLGARYVLVSYPIIAFLWLNNKDILFKYGYLLYATPILWYFQIKDMIGRYHLVLNDSFYFSNPISLINNYLF